jgi:hypothetical protein
MPTTLAHLLLWNERLSDSSTGEAVVLRALIARRAAALRSNNFELIANISKTEEWEPFRTEAILRWAETLPLADLEDVAHYLKRRIERRLSPGEFDPLDYHDAGRPASPPAAEPPMRAEPHAQVLKMYERIVALEKTLTEKPVMNGGLQGVRIMRVVSLMSTASNARISKLRMDGLQTWYVHG